MSNHHHNNNLMPDVSGLVLMAGSWAPIMAWAVDAAKIGLVMSCVVSTLAIADYIMKIRWKLRQIRKDKAAAKKEQDEQTKGTDRG